MSEKQNSHFLKKSFQIAFPLMGSRLLFTLNTFIGVLMLASLGTKMLAATSLITTAMLVITVVSMSLMFSVTPIASRMYGGKKYEKIGQLVQQALIISIFISIIAMILMFSMDKIFLFLNQSPVLCGYVREYFYAAMWGMPAMLLSNALSQFYSAVLKQKFVFWFSFVGLILLIIFSYLLIFGAFGFPKLGVAGFGWAFTIKSWLTLFISIGYLCFNSDFKKYCILKFSVQKDLLLLLIRIGWPIAMQMAVELFSLIILAVFIGWLGSAKLAAYQISSQYLYLLIIPIFSISQSTGIMTGHIIGEKKYNELNRCVMTNFGLALFVIGLVFLIFISFSHFLILLFVNGSNLSSNAIFFKLVFWIIILMIMGQIFDAFRNIMTGALRSLYDTKVPMLISVFCIWGIAIPGAYIASQILHWGIIGIISLDDVSLIITSIFIFKRWQKAHVFLLKNKKFLTHD